MAEIPPEVVQDLIPPVAEGAEKRLSDFLDNPNFSDIVIKNPDTTTTKQ